MSECVVQSEEMARESFCSIETKMLFFCGKALFLGAADTGAGRAGWPGLYTSGSCSFGFSGGRRDEFVSIP